MVVVDVMQLLLDARGVTGTWTLDPMLDQTGADLVGEDDEQGGEHDKQGQMTTEAMGLVFPAFEHHEHDEQQVEGDPGPLVAIDVP